MTLSPPSLSPCSPWLRELKSDKRGLCLIYLLLSCANHVATGNLEQANVFLEQIGLLAAPDGDTMQRIAVRFTEALARRVLCPWRRVCHALDSARAAVVPLAEAALACCHFLGLCPFFRLSYAVTNQAMEGEKVIHIVDLNAGGEKGSSHISNDGKRSRSNWQLFLRQAFA